MKINLELMPDRTIEEIQHLVAGEIEKITDPAILAQLGPVLITPRMEMRDWCYERPVRRFPVWVVAESKDHDCGIAYSDYGFGPNNGWGLLCPSHSDFGADCCWYDSLESALLESRLIEV